MSTIYRTPPAAIPGPASDRGPASDGCTRRVHPSVPDVFLTGISIRPDISPDRHLARAVSGHVPPAVDGVKDELLRKMSVVLIGEQSQIRHRYREELSYRSAAAPVFAVAARTGRHKGGMTSFDGNDLSERAVRSSRFFGLRGLRAAPGKPYGSACSDDR